MLFSEVRKKTHLGFDRSHYWGSAKEEFVIETEVSLGEWSYVVESSDYVRGRGRR